VAKAMEAANYIISISKPSTAYGVTPRKLQKLLFFMQGWHYGLTGKPLFEEEIEARVYGPIVPSVHKLYKKYECFSIPNTPYIDSGQLKESERNIMDEVWEIYGSMDGKYLEEICFMEDPLLYTDKGDVIEKELIKRSFIEKAKER